MSADDVPIPAFLALPDAEPFTDEQLDEALAVIGHHGDLLALTPAEVEAVAHHESDPVAAALTATVGYQVTTDEEAEWATRARPPLTYTPGWCGAWLLVDSLMGGIVAQTLGDAKAPQSGGTGGLS